MFKQAQFRNISSDEMGPEKSIPAMDDQLCIGWNAMEGLDCWLCTKHREEETRLQDLIERPGKAPRIKTIVVPIL